MMMWRVRKTACALILVIFTIVGLGARAATLDQGQEEAAPDGGKVTTLNPATFHHTVLQDSRVHVVEFFSGMCGACQEFAPTYERSAELLDGVVAGRVDVDSEEGLELAIALGVIADGIPSIQMYGWRGTAAPVPVMKGDIMTVDEIVARVAKLTGDATRGADGYYVKM